MLRYLRNLPVVLLMGLLASCNDDSKPAEPTLPVEQLMEAISEYDDASFNAPANPPEYMIINSVRSLAEVQEAKTVPNHSTSIYQDVDFAQKSLVVATSVIYCEPNIDDDNWIWGEAQVKLTPDYCLDLKYSHCSVSPTTAYPLKCKIQILFVTDKLPSDTRLTITESLSPTKPQ